MNTLEKALTDFVEQLRLTKDFTLEQAPLVIHEYLTWEFYNSVFWSVACFIVCVGFIVLALKVLRGDSEAHPTLLLIAPIALAFAIGCLANTSTAFKIKVAPRVVLLEKAASLLETRPNSNK